jgi:hypothetical protein
MTTTGLGAAACTLTLMVWLNGDAGSATAWVGLISGLPRVTGAATGWGTGGCGAAGAAVGPRGAVATPAAGVRAAPQPVQKRASVGLGVSHVVQRMVVGSFGNSSMVRRSSAV